MGLADRFRRAARLARPSYFASEVRRVAGKAERRLRRVEERVVALPPIGPGGGGAARGRVLLSYIIDPFLLPEGAEPSYAHTHDWECREMALAWREAGYAVDAIHWTNTRFEPAPGVTYDVLIDPRLNLERLGPRLEAESESGCLKVLHAETAHYTFHNPAQVARRAAACDRRGVELPPNRMLEENRALEHADAVTLVGNDFTAGTYSSAFVQESKPIFRVPLSNPFFYPYPEARDMERARRRFVWFGSGGLVHKGLDLVLEAFAGLPDLHLTVCGPIDREPAFERAYWRELYETPNIDTEGWVDVSTGGRFQEIAAGCVASVYPSCSEGGGGSVLTCMHAGLVPVVTREASVDLDPSYGVWIGEPTVDGVRRAVSALAARPAAELDAMARAAWQHVREAHTRERFAREYRRVVGELEALRRSMR